MFQQQKDWETRENAFAAFTLGPLTDFWRQRDEAEFTGVDDIPVRFVRFRAQQFESAYQHHFFSPSCFFLLFIAFNKSGMLPG